mgnify:CR=1 FL=1
MPAFAVTFTVDQTAPSVSITSGPANASTATTSWATFGFSSADSDLLGYLCDLDGRADALQRIAEYGIAAHAIYKDGRALPSSSREAGESNVYAWLRRTLETLSEGDSAEEFLEHSKLELFHDQVFCFLSHTSLPYPLPFCASVCSCTGMRSANPLG